MIIYEIPTDWSLKGYLECVCWDGGSGLERLKSHGISYRITNKKEGIQIAKNGYTTAGSYNSILLGWEPPIIFPNTYSKFRNYKWIGKIFTSIQLDGLHVTTPNPLICENITQWDKKDKICCMVISNKSNSNKKNLYFRRREIINEGLKREGFDLYGMGWSKDIKCYKGEIPWDRSKQQNLWIPKIQKMSEYKFSFVTENSSLPGYVTEKIINSLVARCVPIYEGAPDIVKYVPEGCFVDLNKRGISGSYDYIFNMPDEEYRKYINNIEDFITSSKSYYLSSYYLTDQILSVLNK